MRPAFPSVASRWSVSSSMTSPFALPLLAMATPLIRRLSRSTRSEDCRVKNLATVQPCQSESGFAVHFSVDLRRGVFFGFWRRRRDFRARAGADCFAGEQDVQRAGLKPEFNFRLLRQLDSLGPIAERAREAPPVFFCGCEGVVAADHERLLAGVHCLGRVDVQLAGEGGAVAVPVCSGREAVAGHFHAVLQPQRLDEPLAHSLPCGCKWDPVLFNDWIILLNLKATAGPTRIHLAGKARLRRNQATRHPRISDLHEAGEVR